MFLATARQTGETTAHDTEADATAALRGCEGVVWWCPEPEVRNERNVG